jgi:uncharacterized membrane protein
MIVSTRHSPSLSGGWLLDPLFLILVLAGFLLNLYLLFLYMADPGIAGCGGGCGHLLASRWSVVFGVPVTVFGALAYAGLAASLTTKCRCLTGPLLGVVLGSALWFLFAQAVLIGKFCPSCLAAHGVGLAVVCLGGIRDRAFRSAGNLARWGYAAFLLIGLLQVYGPVPPTHRIDDAPGSIQVGGARRMLSFDGGRKSFDATSLPHLGSPDAKHVMVEYFDYQCPSCRLMSGYLSALVEKHPAEICVLLLPVPLDPVCNPAFVTGDVGHPDSCELTRIALAVWRENPDAYPALHKAFLSDPPPKLPAALALARKQVPRARLDAAMADPWIEELIAANVADWVRFSGETKQLPKLLISDKRILHGLPSGEGDFIRVMERELGL